MKKFNSICVRFVSDYTTLVLQFLSVGVNMMERALFFSRIYVIICILDIAYLNMPWLKSVR